MWAYNAHSRAFHFFSSLHWGYIMSPNIQKHLADGTFWNHLYIGHFLASRALMPSFFEAEFRLSAVRLPGLKFCWLLTCKIVKIVEPTS